MSTSKLVVEFLLVGILGMCGIVIFFASLIGEAPVCDLLEPFSGLEPQWWLIQSPILLSLAYVSGIIANTVGRSWSRVFSLHSKLLALMSVERQTDRSVLCMFGRVPPSFFTAVRWLQKSRLNPAFTYFLIERYWWYRFSWRKNGYSKKTLAQCFRHLRATGFLSEACFRIVQEQRSLLRVARGVVFGLALGSIGCVIIYFDWDDPLRKLAALWVGTVGFVLTAASFVSYIVKQIQSDRYLVAFVIREHEIAKEKSLIIQPT